MVRALRQRRRRCDNCGFVSFEQCMATARGAGGMCSQNPMYQASGAPGGGYRARHKPTKQYSKPQPPYSSSTTAPSRIVTRRSICAAISRLWVAMMVARPEARTSWVERAEHVIGGVDVEIAGRLVGEQDARRVGDRARDGDALLFAAGKLRRPMRQPVLEAQIAQQLGAPACAPRGGRGRGSSAAASRSRAPRIPAADGGIGRRSRSRYGGCGCVGVAQIRGRRRRRYRPRPRRHVRAGRRCAGASICRRPEGATSATDWPGHSASSAPLRISRVASPCRKCRLCRAGTGRGCASAGGRSPSVPRPGDRGGVVHRAITRSAALRPDRAAPPATTDRASPTATARAPSPPRPWFLLRSCRPEAGRGNTAPARKSRCWSATR